MIADRSRLSGRIICLGAILVAANGLAWCWAWGALHGNSALLGMAVLAYAFGLRHAVDADHIVAIDNVTRKLMQAGQRPVAVGFFFALGHATVVVLASLVIASTTSLLQARFAPFKIMGALVGTGISAFFLFALAIANIVILGSVFRILRAVKRGEPLIEGELDLLLSRRGILSRLLRTVFRLVSRSWQMYPVGFLFGLGFDTATEIAVLGLAAAQASQGMSLWTIMIFPALFTAGMSLVDTADGVLMLGAYGWAFIKPVRKLYYNLTITLVSVLMALTIGGLELLGLFADWLGLEGSARHLVDFANDNLGMIGYLIVAIFAATWLVSVLVHHGREARAR